MKINKDKLMVLDSGILDIAMHHFIAVTMILVISLLLCLICKAMYSWIVYCFVPYMIYLTIVMFIVGTVHTLAEQCSYK